MVKHYPKWLGLLLLVAICSGCLSKAHMPQPSSGNYLGIVVDSLTGQGIYGVAVSFDRVPSVTTDIKGKFTYDDLAPGTYQVGLAHSWYNPATYENQQHLGRDTQWNFQMRPQELPGGIVYHSNVGSNDLFYLDLVTRRARKLWESALSETNPVVLPGNRVLFEYSEEKSGGLGDVYCLDLKQPGVSPQPYFQTWDNSSHPSVDATGNKVVFSSRINGVWNVVLYDAVSGEFKVVGQGEVPSINPEGTMIAYEKSDHLHIYEIANAVDTTAGCTDKISYPAWRRGDGLCLAVESWADSGQPHRICLIDPQTPGELVFVTFSEDVKEEHHHPAWSADGTILFFSANICYSRKDIYAVRVSEALQLQAAAQVVLLSSGSGDKRHFNWGELRF